MTIQERTTAMIRQLHSSEWPIDEDFITASAEAIEAFAAEAEGREANWLAYANGQDVKNPLPHLTTTLHLDFGDDDDSNDLTIFAFENQGTRDMFCALTDATGWYA